ncbi:MAG: alpha/beta hydrolase, partial [Lachnospiraceae bacterium]|nr:alpha/beta hydrolase [Lachnospiraceae bacterium]
NMHCEWTEYIYPGFNEDESKIIFYCHGGGYMTGSCIYARELTTKLARRNSCKIFCFDYRLAPEYAYPAALEDALTAWKYILSCGYLPENIIMAGDSAGGNLCLVLSLMLKQLGMQMPKCLILFSPWTDMTASGKSYHSKELLDPVLDNNYIQKAIKCYLQDTSPAAPFVSPIFADFSGFPPVYIQVGDNEILLDDSQMLYNQLLKYNVYARLDIFPGLWHVFQMSPIKAARLAIDKVYTFINELDIL